MTVDTPEDFERTKMIIEALYKNGKIYLDDIITLLENIPIESKEIKETDSIKLIDKRITYKEWRNIMTKRIENSHIIKLGETFYDENKQV